ncbi:MAG: carboxypeptidase regulatory-like domain-containing protein [Acidobacteria bacterium]|nr:carboxypeptidase regulatory-like domain-containing protein [Acidobacteriota bacterium]
MQRRLLLSLLIMVATWFGPLAARVDACSCVTNGCHVLPQDGRWFLATVVAIEPATPGRPFDNRVVRLDGVTPIRGEAPREIRLSGSSCDYTFTVGTRYFIEADEGEAGTFGVSSCGPTRPVGAVSSLPALITSPQEKRPSLWGTVTALTHAGPPSVRARGGVELANALVELRSGGIVHQTRTSSAGEYSFSGVRPGPYTLRVRPPADRRDVIASEAESIMLIEGATCLADVITYPSAAVTGRIVQAGGKPGGRGRVLLYPPGGIDPSRLYTTVADAQGRYRFEQVLAGSYVAGVGIMTFRGDPEFAPAQAMRDGVAIFDVLPGEITDSGTITTRIAPFAEVRGTLMDPAGGPVNDIGIYVVAVDAAEASFRYETTTRAGGTFTLELPPGVRYRIFAWNGSRRTPVVEFAIGDAPLALAFSERR